MITFTYIILIKHSSELLTLTQSTQQQMDHSTHNFVLTQQTL